MLECAVCLHLRSRVAQALLDEFARAGLFASSTQGKFVQDAEHPGLQELISNNYVEPMVLLGRTDHSNYTLSSKGRASVKQITELVSPCPITEFERPPGASDREDRTTCELVLELSRAGWQDIQQRKSKVLQPYTPGGELVWYWVNGDRISKLYLRTLLLCPELFKHGLMAVHHFQSQAYYKACLERVGNPLPSQPLDYYKLLISRSKGANAGKRTTRVRRSKAPQARSVPTEEYDEVGRLASRVRSTYSCFSVGMQDVPCF